MDIYGRLAPHYDRLFPVSETQARFLRARLDELGPRFQSIYPWQRLDLPVLTGREWLVLDRPA